MVKRLMCNDALGQCAAQLHGQVLGKGQKHFSNKQCFKRKTVLLQMPHCCPLPPGWMWSTNCGYSLGEVVYHLQGVVAATSPSICKRCNPSIFIPVAFFAPYSSILAVGADITVAMATVWANRVCKSVSRDADDSVKGGAEETWKGWTKVVKINRVWSSQCIISIQSERNKETNTYTHKGIKNMHLLRPYWTRNLP